MRNPLSLAAALTLLSTGLPAVADEVYFDTVSTRKASRDHGRYFGAFGGGSSNAGAAFGDRLSGASLSEDGGWLLGLEFGYTFNTGWPVRPSLELEFMMMNNALDADGAGSLSLSSDLRAWTLMANASIALDLSDRRDHVGDFLASFHPYIGAGIGGAIVEHRNVSATDTDGRRVGLGDDSDITWAWQVFAGIEYAFTDEFSLYGEYKRLGLNEIGDGSITDTEFDIFTLGFKFQY